MGVSRTARRPQEDFPLWDDVEADLKAFHQLMRTIRRLLRHQHLTPETSDALWGLFTSHEQAFPDLNYWITFNFPRHTDYADVRQDFRQALYEAGRDTSRFSDQQRAEDLTAAVAAYTKKVQDLVGEAGAQRFEYNGIKVKNPSRLVDRIIFQLIDGLDFITALFKRKRMLKALREGIKSVRLMYAPDNPFHGIYHQRSQTITVNARALYKGTSRLWKDWLQEVWLHEFGHHVHMTYISPTAKAVWDSAWEPVEKARGELHKKLVTTGAERRRFFGLIESNGWSASKAARKLKGLDKLKFAAWLREPGMGEPFIHPKTFRWTKRGLDFMELLQDPEAKYARDGDITLGEDEWTDEFVRKQAEMLVKRVRGILLLDSDRDDPISGDLVEKIRAEDTTVDVALDKLELPSDYARQDPKEDFAESFVAFMVNPGALSDQATFRMQRTLSLSGLYGRPVMEAAVRVAERHVRAAFFNVGDLILFGKYKNKRGKIIGFGVNDKGQPTVEIEPIPKGRKKNKVMGLFKIWNLSKKEEALAQMKLDEERAKKGADMTPQHIAAVWHHKNALQVGRGQENGTVRLHRYRDSILVTDLTNAGKRGKKVRTLSVELSYNTEMKSLDGVARMLTLYDDFDDVVATLNDFLVDYPHALKMYFSDQRGVDVMPAGFEIIEIHGEHVYISAEYKTFRVQDLGDRYNMPRCIPAIRGGKRSIPVFYRWVRDNQSRIKNMTFHEVMKEMDKNKIQYHYYCAMD